MSRRRRRRGGISLPWEQRGNLLRQLLAGQRWKVGLALIALVLFGALLWSSADRRARLRESRLAIAEVRRAVRSFRSQVGRCPRSTSELVHPPRSRTRYLREMPKDGWGQELFFQCPGHQDPDRADIVSAGPSGDFFKDDNVW